MSDLAIHPIFHKGSSTDAIELIPFWRIRLNGTLDDVDRIFDAVIKVTPLIYGNTDHNAFRTEAGYEYYRPTADTPTGAEEETCKRPGVVELSFAIEPDENLLKEIMNIIYQLHSYYEPPITVEPILRSATKGLDDSDNPYRWWNTVGDWKTAEEK